MCLNLDNLASSYHARCLEFPLFLSQQRTTVRFLQPCLRAFFALPHRYGWFRCIALPFGVQTEGARSFPRLSISGREPVCVCVCFRTELERLLVVANIFSLLPSAYTSPQCWKDSSAVAVMGTVPCPVDVVSFCTTPPWCYAGHVLKVGAKVEKYLQLKGYQFDRWALLVVSGNAWPELRFRWKCLKRVAETNPVREAGKGAPKPNVFSQEAVFNL